MAVELGIIVRGERKQNDLPVEPYTDICRELQRSERKNGVCRLPQAAMELVARAVCTSGTLSCLSFICVSDYVGNTRFKRQGRMFTLTDGERDLLKRAHDLRAVCINAGVTFKWQLVLADGWGAYLYSDRVLDGGLEAYCEFMKCACMAYDFPVLRWTSFMEKNSTLYKAAREVITERACELAPWEATKGEIAHDHPATKHALAIAHEHITMRAAEGQVLTSVLGPTIVLSTEGKGLTRYDNLLVEQKFYPIVFNMPFWPHRLK